MTISQRPQEIREALALQAKCELRRVALHQCHASAEDPKEAAGPFSVHVSHNSVANEILDGILRIEVRFQIECYDASDPPAMVFNVHCSFVLDYEIEDRTFLPSAESISAFKDGNAVFNCWSYTREFFQNIASRMEMSPPPLPLLRISPKPDREDVPKVRRHSVRKRPALESMPENPGGSKDLS